MERNGKKGESNYPTSKMGRISILEQRTSALVILEQRQLDKIDKIAGTGNRSSYFRFLVDSIDSRIILKGLELEKENALLNALKNHQNARIAKLEAQILSLRKRLKAARSGKIEDLSTIEGIEKIEEQYKLWTTGRSERREKILIAHELEWIKYRARDADADPKMLLEYLHAKAK